MLFSRAVSIVKKKIHLLSHMSHVVCLTKAVSHMSCKLKGYAGVSKCFEVYCGGLWKSRRLWQSRLFVTS